MNEDDRQDREDKRAALYAAIDVLKYKDGSNVRTQHILELADKFYEWL